MIPADSDVRAVLEAALGGPVGGIARRPSPFRTSFALEEVDVEVDGSVVELMFKDLSEAGLGEARAAKPAFLYDPLREIEIYRDVLGPADLGTPRFEAADVDRRWLFVERVRGVELFQVGRRATWEHVARWVGRLHRELAGVTPPRALCHDAGFYAQWPERAVEVVQGAATGPPPTRSPRSRAGTPRSSSGSSPSRDAHPRRALRLERAGR
jgi:hypothetical protein